MAPTLDPDFVRAVFNGARMRVREDQGYEPGGRASCTVERVGRLSLPSGRIVASDPVYLDATPFETIAPTGKWPVTVAMAGFGGFDIVALAKLAFADDEVAEWRIATKPGQDAAQLGEDEIFGYPVDMALGCFVDEAAAAAYWRQVEAGERRSILDRLMELGEANYRMLTVGDRPELNMAMFRSGFGDGEYASYFGYDADDELVALVTDFAVLSVA